MKNEMTPRIPTQADEEIAACLSAQQSFAVIAGAGSGKTSSLVTALEYIQEHKATNLRRNSQKVACITYTNRAVDEIKKRLHHSDLFAVSTLHTFLWKEIKRFSKDINEAISNHRIPQLIEKARTNDNGGNSKKARNARDRIARLEQELAEMHQVQTFTYDDSTTSRYSEGQLDHDDVIEVAGYLLKEKEVLRKALGFRYPYIFVDEAQDTFTPIVEGFNKLGDGSTLPVVGYFGDPWQQIYDKRAGDFSPPPNGKKITKTENFRCSENVISLLNAFREDITQYAAGDAAGRTGSVHFTLVQTEIPEGARKTYTSEQLDRTLQIFDSELADSGWAEKDEVICLFLARQMIARRVGFSTLNALFNGDYASKRAKDRYESGEHFLLTPFLNTIWPLVTATREGNTKEVISLLRAASPAFDLDTNRGHPLKDMIHRSNKLTAKLIDHWRSRTTRDVLQFCHDTELVRLPERLIHHLKREARGEEYDPENHTEEKADWLCDEFFNLQTTELEKYCEFTKDDTTYSTQHGVKGEEYPNVLVVYDDIEAKWNNYNFTKLLTPNTSGQPTDGQFERSQKLAYVCFSRATTNLRVLLFTPDPSRASQELIAQGLSTKDNITIIKGA